MSRAARIGDPFTCGDYVAEGSNNVFVNELPLAFIGAATTGHGCWNPNHIAEGAGTVYVNDKKVAYGGHSNEPHTCNSPPHTGTLINSDCSPNVFVED